MKVSHLRWIVLVVAFLVLTYGGWIGIYLGDFLPTFSCRYLGRARGGTCFLWSLQHHFSGHGGPMHIIGPPRLMLLYFFFLIIIAGKAWCGWICPLGLMMDVFDLIRRKLHIGYIAFPEKLRARLGLIKWALLFIAVFVPLSILPFFMRGGITRYFWHPFCQLCPARYIAPLFVGNPGGIAVNFANPVTITMTVLGLLITAVTIVGSLIKRRFWCVYCPMGLVLGFFRGVSFLKLKKDCQACTRCEICYNVCPVEIKEVYMERDRENVTFQDCILCMRCVENCPEDNALRVTYLGKTIYKASRKGFFSRQRAVPRLSEKQSSRICRRKKIEIIEAKDKVIAK